MLAHAQVQHVARLARLELDDAELERMRAELSKVLEHIERIRELELDGVPPTSHVVDICNVLRPDQPEPCLSLGDALASAPEPVRTAAGEGFGVPSPGQAPP